MSSLSPAIARPKAAIMRSLFAVATLALVVAGCSASGATFPPIPTGTGTSTGTGGATATATIAAGSSVAAATQAPTATTAVTAAPTAPPTPTHAPTAAATPAPTLPPLGVGLCAASQLKLAIDYWVGDGTAGAYAHVSVTNVSGTSCNMRGTPEARIVNAGNLIIVDSGPGTATVSNSDSTVTLAPGSKSYDILDWENWCKAAPSQNVKVAVVLPFTLGALLASANGVAPIPACFASGARSTVTGGQWT